jgi:hypothetical protein
MSEKTITLAAAPGIPSGFSLISEQMDGATVHFLRRDIDDRRARVVWEPGTKHYTRQQLSALMAKDGDDDNPILKGYV